jgi:NitT/TauT family transport system permease protein
VGLAERASPGTWPAALADRATADRRRSARRAARSTLAKVLAVAIALLVWQLVAMSGWKPTYVLPGPDVVLPELWNQITTGKLLPAVALTLRRAFFGFGIAIIVGGLLGIAVSRWSLLRAAVGSLITGLQTMPSIAWFPLAILLFKLSEEAILFVVVLGAAPAIANGIIAGIDHVPPLLVRAGRVLGASGLGAYRHVIIPAALPSIVAGLKQGWAFAWRSLMAGELLVIVAGQRSLGVQLQFARELVDAPALLAIMLTILAIGLFVDGVVFGLLERGIRQRRGLLEEAAT